MKERLGWLRALAAIVLATLFSLPLYIVLVGVFKPSNEIIGNPLGLPLTPTLANFKTVLGRPDGLYWSSLLNSIQITVISILLATVVSAMLAHYLVRSRHWAARATLAILLCGLMVPPAVVLQPVTEILRAIGLNGTLPGLVLVNIGYYLPFGVFVLMGFIRTIPLELEEAAQIDGAGRFRVFWQVVFPLLRPATASCLIFFGVWIWNDFLNPLIILGPVSGTTVTVGLYRSIGERSADYGAVFAFMVLASLPVVILYVLLQRHFIKGLTGGATKG